MLHLNDRCFYSCFWIIPDLRCQKRLWILCFSATSITIWRSCVSSLSRVYILVNLLGNERPWFVICGWWTSIRFVCFCASRFVALFFEKRCKFYLSSKFFLNFFILKRGKFRFQRWNCSYRASKSRGNTDTEGWKFPLTKPFAGHSLYSCSYGLYLNQTEPTAHRSTWHICDLFVTRVLVLQTCDICYTDCVKASHIFWNRIIFPRWHLVIASRSLLEFNVFEDFFFLS